MYAQLEKTKENKGQAVANSVTQNKRNKKQGFGFVDNRLESIVQRAFQIEAASQNATSIGSNVIQMKKAIFNNAALLFATQDPGRLPSLYFHKDTEMRRLRQQHGRGPTIDTKKAGTLHYFFENEEQYNEFYSAADSGQDVSKWANNHEPYNGAWHIEYDPVNKKGLHKSGGRVIAKSELNYTDDDLEKMSDGIEKWKKDEISSVTKATFNQNKKDKAYTDKTAPDAKGFANTNGNDAKVLPILVEYANLLNTGKFVGAAEIYRNLLRKVPQSGWSVEVKTIDQTLDGLFSYFKNKKEKKLTNFDPKNIEKTAKYIKQTLNLDITN